MVISFFVTFLRTPAKVATTSLKSGEADGGAGTDPLRLFRYCPNIINGTSRSNTAHLSMDATQLTKNQPRIHCLLPSASCLPPPAFCLPPPALRSRFVNQIKRRLR